MKCLNPECPADTPPSVRFCPTCGSDNGYPNVRQAEAETEALGHRLAEAEDRAAARACLAQLNAFREKVADSVAVIATSPNKAHALLKDPSALYTTFYRMVASGARMPLPNWFDRVRGVADELLFPNYRDYISFAALSLDGVGCSYYGTVHLVLADFAIRQRATVFEENSLLYSYRNRLGVHKELEPGHRATWVMRDHLAAVKLEPKLDPHMTAADFAGLLLSRPHRYDSDMIEVHIYERLNGPSIRKVLITAGGDADDEIMKQQVLRVCQRNGIACEDVR